MKNILGLALLGDSGFFSALIGVGDEGEFIGGAGAGAAWARQARTRRC